MNVLFFISGFCIGMAGLYLCLYKRLQKIESINRQTLVEKDEIEQSIYLLSTQKKVLEENNNSLSNSIQQLLIQKEQILSNLHDLELYSQNSAEAYYNKAMEVAAANIENSILELSSSYEEAKSDFEKEYALVREESVKDLKQSIAQAIKTAHEYESALAELKAKTDAATAAAIRAEELKTQDNFYRIQLGANDKQEIDMIREIIPYLRDKEAVNKVIWKCYYEKPTNDLIGRVIGAGAHTGIYKITHIDTQRCYVGQAVNLSDRWKQHIKRGLGAETATKNKLYPAMMEYGPENFTFEVIEECDRSLLDSREDYWQDYFKAKEFGYSIK